MKQKNVSCWVIHCKPRWLLKPVQLNPLSVRNDHSRPGKVGPTCRDLFNADKFRSSAGYGGTRLSTGASKLSCRENDSTYSNGS